MVFKWYGRVLVSLFDLNSTYVYPFFIVRMYFLKNATKENRKLNENPCLKISLQMHFMRLNPTMLGM